VTTGDEQGECHIYRTDDRFRTFERIGDGSQVWRAVRLFFTAQHVAWLMDSQDERNFACRISRSDGGSVGQTISPDLVWHTVTDGLYSPSPPSMPAWINARRAPSSSAPMRSVAERSERRLPDEGLQEASCLSFRADDLVSLPER
jgi:hypothetical protein